MASQGLSQAVFLVVIAPCVSLYVVNCNDELVVLSYAICVLNVKILSVCAYTKTIWLRQYWIALNPISTDCALVPCDSY